MKDERFRSRSRVYSRDRTKDGNLSVAPSSPSPPSASRIHDKDRLTRKNFPRISPDTARLKKLVDPEDLALVALRRGMMADRS